MTIPFDTDDMLDLGRCRHGRVNDGECIDCEHEAEEERRRAEEARAEEREHMAEAGRLP